MRPNTIQIVQLLHIYIFSDIPTIHIKIPNISRQYIVK